MALRIKALPFVKLCVAAAAIVALASIPARQLAPQLSVFELAALLAGAFLALVCIAVCSLTIAQFVLRKGGTDTQWLWFGGEPPGLAAQREERPPQP